MLVTKFGCPQLFLNCFNCCPAQDHSDSQPGHGDVNSAAGHNYSPGNGNDHQGTGPEKTAEQNTQSQLNEMAEIIGSPKFGKEFQDALEALSKDKDFRSMVKDAYERGLRGKVFESDTSNSAIIDHKTKTFELSINLNNVDENYEGTPDGLYALAEGIPDDDEKAWNAIMDKIAQIEDDGRAPFTRERMIHHELFHALEPDPGPLDTGRETRAVDATNGIMSRLFGVRSIKRTSYGGLSTERYQLKSILED